MKIAFFSVYHPHVAGVVTFIDVLAQEYLKQGHEVVIFTHRGASNPLEYKGVRLVTFLGVPSLIYPGIKVTLPNSLTFTQIIKKEAPDIIHVNTPDILSEMAVRTGRKLGIPTVITFHTLFTEGYEAYLFPKVPGLKNFKKWLIKTLLEKRFKKFDIVCASTPLTKKLVERQGIACHLIPIGVDITTFRPKKSYKKTNQILSVSRLGFEKKIDVVLRAIKELRNPELKLTIVGEGPARKMLESLTKDLELEEQVTFTGQIPRETLQHYFESHDFFVNASDTETFGYVTAEAMAAGLPLVGVESQGTGELVEEGKNGFLAQPNDPQSFAAAIKKMLAVQDYQKMGSASVEMVQAYSPENSAKEHLALYRKLIKERINGTNE